MSLLDPLIAHAAVFNIQTGIPGPVDINNYGILGYIQNAYVLALVFSGALALGSIVYGAVQYTVSRGNPSKLADAWDRILQALIGILLLVGAGTILSIVNPGLLSLELPRVLQGQGTPFEGDAYTMQIVETDTEKAPDNSGVTLGATKSCATTPSNCSSLSSKGFTCKHASSCTAHNVIADGVACAADKLGIARKGIIFTDAYPSAGYPAKISHCSKMHFNGCSADLVLPASAARSCDDVNKFMNALASCGVQGLNEYRHGIFANCGFAGSGHSTGNHLHLNGCPKGTWDGLSQELINRLNNDPKCKK